MPSSTGEPAGHAVLRQRGRAGGPAGGQGDQGDVDVRSLDSRSSSPDPATPLRRASLKSKKSTKGSKKLSKSAKSPYEGGVPRGGAWRSLTGSVTAYAEPMGTRTPRQMWLHSLRQGNGLTQSLKRPGFESAGGNGSGVPDYLKEALGMTRPRHARSSHTGYVPGTPDYKEREAMYDEILELKKALTAERAALETMRTRARRLEAEGARKDKQLEQLLMPQAQGSEFTRSLGDRKRESGAVINGLKQRVLKLEQQCREKDTALTRLREDVRCTSLEEMRVAAETYLLEIDRLREALAAVAPTPASREGGAAGRHKEKALGAALRRLSEKHALVQQDNARLRSELSVAHAAPPPVPPPAPPHTGTSGTTAPQQQQPVQREAGNRTVSARRTAALEEGSAGAGGEDGQDAVRLRGAVRRLKEDRRALQGELAQRDKEIQQLRRATSDLEVENKRLSVRHAEEQMREEVRALQEKLRCVERELEEERRRGEERRHRGERDLSPATAGTASQSRHSSSDSQGRNGQSRQSSTDSQRPSGQSRHSSPKSDRGSRSRPCSASPERGRGRSGAAQRARRAEAAVVIQRQWRRHRYTEKSDEIDEAAQLIQSVMRSHGTRRRLLIEQGPGHAAEEGADPAIVLIQSAVRAHIARRAQLENRAQAEPTSTFTPSPTGYAVDTVGATARLAL
ncbi:IQ domain-containing protein E isoform X1 [Lethenteron reissneri]|uniref:IQ domain-containing protein E isoform X1 n=1 Tax=Lethenteron reissneri TaxID=7753 RepID=UPI002AB71AE8|nr:IQ domain-containing protein E isoform X1 [Lethenteron reissneri]